MTKSLRRHYKSYDECHGNERLKSLYDWLLTSWADTDNYTLYISANLTNVTHIYVGVKFDNNDSMSSLILLQHSPFMC